jgi:hypothetical protein
MPGARLLSVEGDEELRRVAATLRRLSDGQGLNRQLRAELEDVGRQGAASVRQSIRRIPSKGQSGRAGRRSLRSKMAAATEYKVRTTRRPGVIVWVNPRRMPPGERNLPGYMEGARPFHRWRKPTFGHSPWMQQRPHPYFDRGIRPVQPMLQRAGERVVDRIAEQIEK